MHCVFTPVPRGRRRRDAIDTRIDADREDGGILFPFTCLSFPLQSLNTTSECLDGGIIMAALKGLYQQRGEGELKERHPPFFVTAPRDISSPFLRLLLSLGGRVGGRGGSSVTPLPPPPSPQPPRRGRRRRHKSLSPIPLPSLAPRERERLLSLLFLVGFNHAEKMPRLWEQFPRDVGFRGQFSETSSEGGERLSRRKNFMRIPFRRFPPPSPPHQEGEEEGLPMKILRGAIQPYLLHQRRRGERRR